MHISIQNDTTIPYYGGSVSFRILDAEGGNPVTNFWYTLSTGARPPWQNHTKSAETFYAEFEENETQTPRSITYTFYRNIVVNDENVEESESVTVTQLAFVVPETVPSVELPAGGSSITVDILGAQYAHTFSAETWFNFSVPSRDKFTVSCDTNPTTEQRTGEIELDWEGVKRTVTVTQEASLVVPGEPEEPEDVISGDVVILSTLEHTVSNSLVNLTITPNANAVLPLVYSGSDVSWIYDTQLTNGAFVVTVRRNLDGNAVRSGRFRITDSLGRTNTVVVTQAAGNALNNALTHTTQVERYVLRQEAISVPVYQNQAIHAQMDAEFNNAKFTVPSVARSGLLAPVREDLALTPELIDGYDTYNLCCRHTETGDEAGRHDLIRGAVLYRLVLPWAAGTPKVTSLRVSVMCDAYTRDGIDVSLVSMRRDLDEFSINDNLTVIQTDKKIARRRISNNMWYSSVEEVQLSAFDFQPTETTTLAVLVKLNNMSFTRGLWVEGSGTLNLPVTLRFDEAVPNMGDRPGGNIWVDPVTGEVLPYDSDDNRHAMILSSGQIMLPDPEITEREFAYISETLDFSPITNLMLSPETTTFTVPKNGGVYNFTVVSLPTGETAYSTTASDTNWLDVDTDEFTFSVTIPAQEAGSSSRTGTVTVASGETQTKVLTFNQAAGDPITILELSQSTASIDALFTQGTSSFNVTSLPTGETEFAVESNVDWLTHEVVGNTIFWNAKKNPYSGQRVGGFVVTSGTRSTNMVVTQAANATPIALSATASSYDYLTATGLFTVTLPTGASIVSAVSEDTAKATTSLVGTTVNLSVSKNWNAPRTICITVNISYDGMAFTLKHWCLQKGFTDGTYASTIAKVAANGAPANVVSATAVTGVKQIAVCGNVCWFIGSYTGTGLFGDYHQYVTAVDITGNAVKDLSDFGSDTPLTFTYEPDCVLKGFVSGKQFVDNIYDDGIYPSLGDVLYVLARKQSTVLNTNYLFDYTDGTIAHGTCYPTSGVPNYAALSYEPTEFPEPEWWQYYDWNPRERYYENSTYKHRYKFYNRMATSKKEIKPLYYAIDTTTKTVYRVVPYRGGNTVATQYNPYCAFGTFTLPQNPSALAYSANYSGCFVAGNGVGGTGNNLVYISDAAPTNSTFTTTMPSAHTPPPNRLTPNSWDNFYMDFDQTDRNMVISGSFTDIDNTGISYLAKWDGTKWTPYSTAFVPKAPVKAMDTYSGGAIVYGDTLNYKYLDNAPAEPEAEGQPDDPELPAQNPGAKGSYTPDTPVAGNPVVTTPEGGTLSIPYQHFIGGLRKLYATAFSGGITHKTVSALTVDQPYQSGIACVLRFEDTGENQLIYNISLSALMLYHENPFMFTPTTLSLTAPPNGMLNIPPNSELILTAWWKSNVMPAFTTLTSAFAKASFWSGLNEEAAGYKRIGRMVLRTNTPPQNLSFKIDGKQLTGLYGTLLITPWLRVDKVTLTDVTDNVNYGLGSLVVDADDIVNEELCWNPTVKFLG